MRLDISKVENLSIDGVDMMDYPDFCDVYFDYGTWADTGKELTDDELELLTQQNGDILNEMAHENVHWERTI